MKLSKGKKETEFGAVTVKNGPLAGMVFTPINHTVVARGVVRVKYQAPSMGPRIIVEHREIRGEFSDDNRAENVRLAFSTLLPGSIVWESETGYRDRKSGQPLKWSRGIARFVNNTSSVKLPKLPETKINQPEIE